MNVTEHDVMFEAAIKPLLQAHESVEADILALETRLAKLKDHRNRLRQAVRAVAPERLPQSAQPPKKKSKAGTKFSLKTKEAVYSDLLNRSNGAEFSTATILAQPGYDGPGKDALRNIMRSLHEGGSLRLVRRGRGGERFYEVIR